MRLYPAIDIRNGKCVRLCQGSFDSVKVYRDRPADAAIDWKEQGAEYIHVVDLDGAQAGNDANLASIEEIVKVSGLPVQTGGGIRSLEDIEKRLNRGVSRVIIGTKAVNEPEFVGLAIKEFGADKIVAGLDGRKGMAATHGWEQESTKSILELALQMIDMGLKTVVYTDISRDGMLTGPDFGYTEELVKKTGIDIIASGGIAGMSDLERLETVGVEGAILGKSLYEGRISLKEAAAIYRKH